MTTKELTNIQIFTITDIHIGNKSIDSTITLEYCKSYLMDNMKTIQSSDIFLLTGDIPDRLLYTNSKEYGDLVQFMDDICSLCDNLGLTLIYIEGTPLHEMGQIPNIYNMMRRKYPELDFRYHDEVGIYEFIKDDETMTYLTVPDQMASTDDALYSKVTSTIRSKGLTKVDFMFTHTEFEEALSYPTVGVKSTALWSNLVNYYIINGHIHYHSVRDSVITTGALNFLTHGDEEIKGGVVVKIKNCIKSYKQIPTKHFTKFKTLTIREGNYLVVVEQIKKLFRAEKHPYFIRVVGDLPQETINILKEEKPLMNLKVIKEKQSKPHTTVNVEKNIEQTYKEINITPNNIESLIREDLREHLTEETISILREHI